MDPEQPGPGGAKGGRLDVLAGLALGALLGLLVGLSSSPVTATLVSGLAALLGALLGLQRGEGAPALAPVRVVGLGLGGVLGVFGGMWIRTHDLLAPLPAAEVARWEAAGLRHEDALAVVVARRTGGSYQILEPTPKQQVDALVEAGLTQEQAIARLELSVAPGAADDGASAATAASTVLFSDRRDDVFCAELRQLGLSPQEELIRWRLRGGNWERAAGAVQGVDAERQAALVPALRELACGEAG